MSLDAQGSFSFPESDDRPASTRAEEEPAAEPVRRPTFYILDAYSLIFQVFHAIPEMTGPAGQPTQAVFGIFRDLLDCCADRKPDYLAAAFDGDGPVFRSEIYPQYKANRSEMPVDLVSADPRHPPPVRGVPGARTDGARDGGRRRDRDAGPPRRRAGTGRLHRHGRQGRPPADRRPCPAAQPPDEEGDGRGGPGEGLGRPARPGRRLPGPDGRLGGQHPGRPGHRRRLCRDVAQGVRDARRPARQSRPGQGPQEAASPPRSRRDRPAGAAAGGPARRLAAGDRLGRTQDPAARPRGPAGHLHRVRLPRVPRRARTALRCEARSRPAMGRRLPAGGHPRIVRGLPRRAAEAAQVLHRHRDDLAGPAPGRPGGPVVLVEGGRGVLPAGARAGRIATARCGSDAGRAAADPGGPGDREGRAERQV